MSIREWLTICTIDMISRSRGFTLGQIKIIAGIVANSVTTFYERQKESEKWKKVLEGVNGKSAGDGGSQTTEVEQPQYHGRGGTER